MKNNELSTWEIQTRALREQKRLAAVECKRKKNQPGRVTLEIFEAGAWQTVTAEQLTLFKKGVQK